ncbi:MAG: NfeD family protein [Bacteroidota bacterium]
MEILIVAALVILGLAFLFAEVFFIPGTTIAGLIGTAMTVLGIIFSYSYFGSTIGTATLGVSLISATTAGYYGLSSKTWERFALHSPANASKLDEKLQQLFVGQEGRAISALRPSGTVDFDGETYEVRTKGQFVDAGADVRILKLEGRKVFVEETV